MAAEQPTSTLADAALMYAQHGVKIFPVAPRGKLPALPRCTRLERSHRPEDCDGGDGHGFHDATSDPDTIVRWWADRPDANIGIALGANQIFAVDVDGPEGRSALDELEDAYEPLPATYEVVTGRAEGGGRHHIYQQPDDLTVRNSKLGHPKLETRGDGGYVVAPPSIHESGRPYMAHGSWAQIVDAPRWLVLLATRPEPSAPVGEVHTTVAGHDQHAEKRLRGLAGNLAMMAPDTGRNNALNHAAYIAGQLVGAGRLDRTHVEKVLTTAAERCGLTPAETAATIRSGIDSGTGNPDHDTYIAQDVPNLTPLDVGPGPQERPADGDTDGPRTSWAPVDGTDYIDGTYVPPQPTQLARTDGTCLFYPGRINLLFGESEAGKGWVALHAVAQALTRGDTVLYIDFEDYPDTIYARLALLGATKTQLSERFAYIRPDAALDDPGRAALSQTVDALEPDLVILDGVTGAMSLHALDTNSSTDVDQFYSILGEPLARTQAAVVFIDHVTKSAEGRGKGPIGSQHKRARVSGASYEVSSVQPIAPGRAGKLRLKIDKDRLGAVRSTHPSQAGEFTLDSTREGSSVARIYAPSSSDGDPFRPTHAMVAVSKALEIAGDQGLSRRGVEESGGFSKDVLWKAAEALVEEGYAIREPSGKALIHRFVRRFVDGPTVLDGSYVPDDVPMSPNVPDAPGTPLGHNASTTVPMSPALLERGHRDVSEPTPRDTHQKDEL